MHAENHRAVARPLVDVMDAQLAAIAVGDLGVVGRIGVAGEVLEALVGGS